MSTVRELLAALRIHDPNMEVVLGKARASDRDIAGPVARIDIVYRLDRLVVELAYLTPTEAATALPVLCLWPE